MLVKELLKNCISSADIEIHDIDARMEYYALSVEDAIRLYGDRLVAWFSPAYGFCIRISI